MARIPMMLLTPQMRMIHWIGFSNRSIHAMATRMKLRDGFVPGTATSFSATGAAAADCFIATVACVAGGTGVNQLRADHGVSRRAGKSRAGGKRRRDPGLGLTDG